MILYKNVTATIMIILNIVLIVVIKLKRKNFNCLNSHFVPIISITMQIYGLVFLIDKLFSSEKITLFERYNQKFVKTLNIEETMNEFFEKYDYNSIYLTSIKTKTYCNKNYAISCQN